MNELFVATMRSVAAATLATFTLAVAPAAALDLGGGLRGAVQVDEQDTWDELASLEVELPEDADDALDAMVREDAGEAEPVRRSSVRISSGSEGIIAPLGGEPVDGAVPLRSADPATASLNLFGPQRAPDYVPVIPRQTSSVAVLPQQGWGLDRHHRASLTTLGGF